MRPHERVPFRPSPDFNPRTPVGCDGYSVSVPIELRNFNPRTPVGCDRPIRVCFRGGRYFNPRTPVGCDEGGAGTVGEGGKFQSTHPSGVRQALVLLLTGETFENFNPRTPVGCDPTRIGRPTPAGISIHAPQWGATEEQGPAHEGHQISIHAPQWGATSNQLVGISFVFLISIHAPQWGATGRFGNHVEHRTDFNPRTPVGCDWVMVPPVVMLPRFQSTHPSGVRQSFHIPLWAAASFQSTHPSGVRRPTACNACTTAKYFNPRTPVGCDDRGRNHHPNSQISIHAPQWGATHGGCGLCQQQRISIHAPQWGATGRFRFHADRDAISIHAPQWGATSGNGLTFYGDQFQSTHPSGVRRYHGFERRATPLDFNPRTPVGCDSHSSQDSPEHSYFNPRTPVGCDRRRGACCRWQTISIHAPQWGATAATTLFDGLVQFQSTHPSGVRQVSTCQPKPIQYFNPRTPVGCDGHVVPHAFQAVEISIHAPQWGATHLSSARYHTLTDFNPRTPVGCDMIPVHFAPRHTNFNPRTPVGCDLQQAGHGETQDISIHAPQWGATKPPSRNSHARPISIHAPQWGATMASRVTSKPLTPFQSTHPSGVRRAQS